MDTSRSKTRRYHGTPGHFICAERCRFRLHTSVCGYRISTVGEYYVKADDAAPTEIGYCRLYETMVFKLGEDGEPASWQEIDSRSYNDQDAAEAGHEAMVRKYEAGDCVAVGGWA